MNISVRNQSKDVSNGSSDALSDDLQRKGNGMQSTGNRIASLSAI